MGYCTITDLKNKMSEADIAKLSNDKVPTKIEEDVVNDIITENSEIIDGYVRGRYDLTEVSADPLLKRICVQLSIVDLHERRNKSKLSESLQQIRTNQLNILKQIQRAEVVLDVSDTDDRPLRFSVSSPDKIFTDTVMEDYGDTYG